MPEQELSEEFKSEIQYLVDQITNAKMPEWWTTIASQLAYNLQVHTKGLMFDKITGLYPNEHPDSQKHCVNSFEPITKASIWKAINNIVRVFNNSSYNIQISEKTKQIIEEYQESEGSFFSQYLEDWIKNAVATDPNGYCVWYPLEYTDDLYRYVSHKDIVVPPTDNVLIFISEVESEKKYEFIDKEYTKEMFIDYDYEIAPGIPNVRHGTMRTFNRRLEISYLNKVYHVFTKTHFIRFYKEKSSDTQFKYDYYKHPKELETLPYFENGGIEIEKDLYESFVQPFIPFGNKALIADRNHRAVDLMFSYPRMSEVQQECDACQGRGETRCETGLETCKTCKGSKYITIQSPYKTYRKVQDSFDADNKVFSTPSVEFYTPDVGILNYSKEQPAFYIGMAEEAVFVQRKIDTGNVESFEKKRLDQEGMFSWLQNIAKVLYGNLEMGLQYLENYVNPSPITVSVEKPFSFAILTEAEAFEALNKMLSSSMPVPIKSNQIKSFVNKFISESSPVKRALEILEQFDLNLYYSNDELASFRGMGTVTTKELIIHQKAYPLLMQMYSIDNSLFELEDSKIIEKLQKEIDSKYDLTKDLKTSVLNVA